MLRLPHAGFRGAVNPESTAKLGAGPALLVLGMAQRASAEPFWSGARRCEDMTMRERRDRKRGASDLGRTARLLFLSLLVASSASACAVGREQAFHTTSIQVSRSSSRSSVAIAVHDLRGEVVTGDKEPDFVGLSRGGYGNPFDVTTASGAPLAEDFARTIARGLEAAGHRVQVVPIAHGVAPDQALAKLSHTRADCLLLVHIKRWKSDTYQTTGLEYDLEVVALDERAKPRGRARQHGRDYVGSSFWNPGAQAEAAIPKIFAQKLEALLNDPKIARARRAAPQTAQAARPQS